MALKETWSEASYRRALLWLVLTISLAVREVLHRQRGRFLPLGKTGQELPRIGVQRGQRPICPLVQALSGKGLAPSAQDARAASASPVPARGRAKSLIEKSTDPDTKNSRPITVDRELVHSDLGACPPPSPLGLPR